MMSFVFVFPLGDRFVDVNAVIIQHIQQQLLANIKPKKKHCTFKKLKWNLIYKTYRNLKYKSIQENDSQLV